jgi:predicted nucleic acid-binding protein
MERMNYLVDTNVLLRSVQVGHTMQPVARQAIDQLLKGGDRLHLVPQVVYEFWVVCTRPSGQNGLGLSISQAESELAHLKSQFHLMDDTPATFLHWEALVTKQGVAGKQAHDARLVAAMQVHGFTHILTFNTGDFRRYAGITAIAPDDILKANP